MTRIERTCGTRGAAVGPGAVGVNTAGLADEAPEILDSEQDGFRGIYRLATQSNGFRRNSIHNLGLFAVGIWVARDLNDVDLIAPQPGCSQISMGPLCCTGTFQTQSL